MTTKPEANVTKKGTWHTSEKGIGYIWIVCQNWDYYHEEFYDEGPDLNQQGLAYYALYGLNPELEKHSSRSPTCLSEDEAISRARELLGEIQWL